VTDLTDPDTDLAAADIGWDLETLLEGKTVDDLLDEADSIADELVAVRGRVTSLDPSELASHLRRTADLYDSMGRAGNYASLRFAVDTADPATGALMQRVEERSTQISTRLLFFDLEWVEIDPDRSEELLGDPRLDFAAHHLRSLLRYRDHVLTEPEERIVAEKDVTGVNAWVRLFSELTSDLDVELPGPDGTTKVSLETALSHLAEPDATVRRTSAEAVTEALLPGIRVRASVFNTIAADKSTEDRLRSYPSWISSRNLANEASDESVQALVDAVVDHYEIARRWYRLKARILGVDKLYDYDRMASLAESSTSIGWSEASSLVLDSYASFSPTLADGVRQFLDQSWIDAPVRPGKRPGAFCSYTVPGHHPYVLLNWTGRRRDVLTLAHELGHGLHALLSRDQGVFHHFTPLTLAETASVFGETVTFERLLDMTDDPNERLALLAESVEGSIATVFRQVAMNRFEDAVHTERREVGELSVDRFGELWSLSQRDLMGDAVEVTEGYRSWWSYIPHFIGTPGYVYAYAYGQLLALSVYTRYQEQGDSFIPKYLDLLSAGGSLPPSELGRIVDCDLNDPGFWSAGLELVAGQVTAAEAAAEAAGRL
jgi:oligoendopeptidase F